MGSNAERIALNKQTYYICGQCNDKQWYLVNQEPPVPCPDCGWYHKSRLKHEIPNEFKIMLSQY